MTTQPNFLNLHCPSCGAALELSRDMDRFACAFCGTAQVVERKGGTVSLKILSDAVARVQVGTDRTAAELALKRLSADLESFEKQCSDKRETIKYLRDCGFSIILCFIALICALGAFSNDAPIPFLLSAGLVVFFVWFVVNEYSAANRISIELDEQEEAIRPKILAKIAEQKRVLGIE